MSSGTTSAPHRAVERDQRHGGATFALGEEPPSEPLVVCQRPPVVAKAQFGDQRPVKTAEPAPLSPPWQRHSEAGAAARAEAVAARPGRARLDARDCDSAPSLPGSRLPASTIASCVGMALSTVATTLDHRAAAWPGAAVISSLPALALLRFVLWGRATEGAPAICCGHRLWRADNSATTGSQDPRRPRTAAPRLTQRAVAVGPFAWEPAIVRLSGRGPATERRPAWPCMEQPRRQREPRSLSPWAG